VTGLNFSSPEPNGDSVVFWDRKNNALARPPTDEEDFCSKKFLPNYTENDGCKAYIFYLFESVYIL
jgi:hypothetical protein